MVRGGGPGVRPGNRGWRVVVRTMLELFKQGAAVSGRLRNRRRRLVLTSVMLAMLLAWGTAASAAPGWTVVPSVDPSAGTNVLNAVAVRGPADAWAVGHFTAPDQDDDGPPLRV